MITSVVEASHARAGNTMVRFHHHINYGDHLDSTSFKAATSEGLGGGFDSHVLHMNLIGKDAMITKGRDKGKHGKVVQQQEGMLVLITRDGERLTIKETNTVSI